MWPPPRPQFAHFWFKQTWNRFLHGDFRQLLLGEVQRVVDGSDSKLCSFGAWRQEGSQDGVIGHVHEGHHGVPAFVVVPHLSRERTHFSGNRPSFVATYRLFLRLITFTLNSLSMYRRKGPISLSASPE